jgi:uncharacterized protein (TIGR02266 family)
MAESRNNNSNSNSNGNQNRSSAQMERRKPRYSSNLTVMVFTKGLNHFLSEKAANISSGGLFVCTDHAVEIGDKLHIRITLSDIESYFDLKTRVAWICPSGSSHPQGFGLEFIELNEAQQKVVTDILSKYINVKER